MLQTQARYWPKFHLGLNPSKPRSNFIYPSFQCFSGGGTIPHFNSSTWCDQKFRCTINALSRFVDRGMSMDPNPSPIVLVASCFLWARQWKTSIFGMVKQENMFGCTGEKWKGGPTTFNFRQIFSCMRNFLASPNVQHWYIGINFLLVPILFSCTLFSIIFLLWCEKKSINRSSYAFVWII